MSKTIFDEAVLINLSIGLPGNHRKVDTNDVEVSADKEWIGVSKNLIDPKAYWPIHDVIHELKNYLTRKCIIPRADGSRPALRKFLKPGIYMLPLDSVAEVDAELPKFRQRFEEERDKLAAVYPEKQAEAKEKLNGEFDENDYLSEGEFKAGFYLDTSYITVGTPEALKKISNSIFQKEKEKTQAQLNDVYEEIKQVLRVGFADLVKWMVNILEPGNDGRKKQFHQSSVQKFIDFLADFKAKNLTGDAELEKLVGDVRGILAGHDPESLQAAVKSEGFRERLAEEFKEIQERLDPLVAKRPTRMIAAE